jgi:hypothetical protein
MRYVVGFGRFWYDFIVGDDWRLAVGVVVVLAIGAYAAHHGANIWWALPLVVSALLAVSVNEASRRSS